MTRRGADRPPHHPPNNRSAPSRSLWKILRAFDRWLTADPVDSFAARAKAAAIAAAVWILVLLVNWWRS
jgi:hypothetical protein